VNKKEEPTQFNYSDKKAFNIVESGYDYKLAVVRFAIKNVIPNTTIVLQL
jgi:hypothetical protein